MILFALLFSLYASAETPCSSVISAPVVRSIEEWKYKATALVPGDVFEASAELWPSGLLNLEFVMVGKNGERVENFRGKNEFSAVVAHFGDRVKGIRGFWFSGENLRTFNELTGAPHNLSAAEAAARTWTGRQAIQHGFTRVRVVEKRGTPGNYFKVDARFLPQ